MIPGCDNGDSGPYIQKDNLEKVILIEKMKERKTRKQGLGSIGACLKRKKKHEIMHMAGDRGKWRAMIAIVLPGQST